MTKYIAAELYDIFFINGMYSDVSFTINGRKFNLHKHIISSKSAFFKALISNEQYMGLKDDEIIIEDIDGDVINGDYVAEILGWIYHGNINMADKLLESARGTIYDNIKKIVQFGTLIDFFQIDELNKIYFSVVFNKGKIDEDFSIKYIKLCSKKSSASCEPKKNQYQYVIDGHHYNFDTNSFDKEETNKLLDDIYKVLAHIKYIAPKYFKKYINYIEQYNFSTTYPEIKNDDNINIFKQYIINSFLHIQRPSNIFFQYFGPLKIENEEELKCNSNLIKLDAIGKHDVIVKFLYDILKNMLSETFVNSLDFVYDKKCKIPAKYFVFLMDITDHRELLIKLLDIDNFYSNGVLDNDVIQDLEMYCTSYNLKKEFLDKN